MLRKLFGLSILVAVAAPSFAIAGDLITTGEEARQMFQALPGPASPERCTGACFPGVPCDPACYSTKHGEDYYCIRTRHTRTGFLEFHCYGAH